MPTRDGATVVSEPVGASTWFPDNDTPRDKATYRVAVTTPAFVALAERVSGADLDAFFAVWLYAADEPTGY